ncbi:MAG: hypothetical protein ABI960_03215 [Candidatus Eisenbacteria bacterium]
MSNHERHEQHRPYWTRAHRDWRVWVGVILMLAAMAIYLGTFDLSMRNLFHANAPASSVGGR